MKLFTDLIKEDLDAKDYKKYIRYYQNNNILHNKLKTILVKIKNTYYENFYNLKELGDLEYDQNRSLYKNYLLPCNHEQKIRVQHMWDGKFRCRSCVIDKHEKQASGYGLKIINHTPTNDPDYKLYLYPCGHTKLQAAYILTKSKPACTICVNIEHLNAAERNNLELLNLDDSSTWLKRLYKYKECGHTQSIKLYNVSTNNIPKCITCQKLSWYDEARQEGLELLCLKTGSRTASNNRFKYKLPCGCFKNILHGNVRIGHWACDNHSSYLSKESYIYLIEFITQDTSWIKLGVSSNVERRIIEYKILVPYTSNILYKKKLGSLKECTIIEKELHKLNKDSRLNPEIMRQYKTNGFTECYPITYKNYLYNKLVETYGK